METEEKVDSYEALNEQSFETDGDDLTEWPDWTSWDGVETFKNWPQENAKYFVQAKKKYGISYVRTDKYDLEKILSYFGTSDSEGVEVNDDDSRITNNALPSMESAYGADYG
jgi:hypothetical protein